MCNQIKEIYQYGGKITVCSDRPVFSDLIHVSDTSVTKSREKIKQMLLRIGAKSSVYKKFLNKAIF